MAGGISNTTETAIMALIFNATTWANYAINATASPEANIVVGLSTGTLDDTSTMATTEAAYGSYARVNVARTSGGWTVTNNSVSPVANIDFVQAASGSETETYFSTGKSGGGTAAILFYGTITPNIAVATGVTPRLTTATAITID